MGETPPNRSLRRIELDAPPSTPGRPGAARPVAEPPFTAAPSAPTHPSVPLPPAGIGIAGASAVADEPVERALSEVRSGIGSVRTAISALRGELDAERRDLERNHSADLSAARAAAAERRRTAEDAVRADLAASTADLRRAIAEALGGLTPPHHLRVGEFDLAEHDRIPALLPLLDSTGWRVTGQPDAVQDVATHVLTQLVGSMPLAHLRVLVFDPELAGGFGPFARLRAAHPATFPVPVTDPEVFLAALQGVVASTIANDEAMTAEGASSLGELWRIEGSPRGVHTLVIAQNYPHGLDDRSRAQLARLAASGARRGATVLVLEPGGSALDDVTRHLTDIDVRDGRIRTASLPDGLAVLADPAPDRDRLRATLEALIERDGRDDGPSFPLEELIGEDLNSPWSVSSAESLRSVIGRSGRRTQAVEFRSENPPHPNLLVGGMVGTGKSNVLLDIIYSLAARYSPAELELQLLDFKRGIEFARFDADESGENWLPHVRVLGLESDRDFGLAVLEHLADELERRSELFKAARVGGLAAYRAATGETMPRVLVVIDEFHVLFDGDDEVTERATELLNQVARQARAYGIHLLLASQTISAVSGLRVKGDGIFAQFPLRLSLKNNADESQAILARGNRAAADLRFRGEIVINRNGGEDPEGANERGIAAYADPERMAAVQARLWQRVPDAPRPLVFRGNSYADRPGQWPVSPEPGFAVGRPVSVEAPAARIAVGRDVDQAVAVVGAASEDLVAATIGGMVGSALSGAAFERVVLFDGTGGGAVVRAALAEIRASGVPVERLEGAGITAHLLDIASDGSGVGARPPTLYLGLDLQRVGGMLDEAPGVGDDDYSFDRPTPAAGLRRLAETAALSGSALLGQWSTLRALQQQLDLGHAGVGSYVVLGLALDDYRGLTGGMHRPPAASPRVTIVRRSGGSPEIVVPFAPRAAGGDQDA